MDKLILQHPMKIVTRLLPFIVAGFIFYYLFKKNPPSQILKAIQHLDVLPLVTYAVFYFFFVWFFDCWSLSRLFHASGFPLKTSEMAPARAASYLISILNYGAGHGMLAIFLNRGIKIPILKTTGVIAIVTLLDLYTTILLACAGSFFFDTHILGFNLKKSIQLLGITATLIFIGIFLFLRYIKEGRFVQWLRRLDLLHGFYQLKLNDYLRIFVMRLPIHIAVNTSLYFVAFFFHVSLPFPAVFAGLPIVILVGTLPVTPGGLGTIQAITIALFSPYIDGKILRENLVSPGELLLSMSLLIVTANYVLKAIVGSFFLEKIWKPKALLFHHENKSY